MTIQQQQHQQYLMDGATGIMSSDPILFDHATVVGGADLQRLVQFMHTELH